jgi:hypothetical protein
MGKAKPNPNIILKGQSHEIFCFRFFMNHLSSSPCMSQCTSGVNDTGGKFVTGTADVVDTGGAQWDNGGGGGSWGKLIHGKKPEVENLMALSF